MLGLRYGAAQADLQVVNPRRGGIGSLGRVVAWPCHLFKLLVEGVRFLELSSRLLFSLGRTRTCTGFGRDESRGAVGSLLTIPREARH